jgi:hypothetical protein
MEHKGCRNNKSSRVTSDPSSNEVMALAEGTSEEDEDGEKDASR